MGVVSNISTVSSPPLSAPKKCSTSASPTPPATLPVTRRSRCLAPTEVEERMTSLTCEGGREGGREGREGEREGERRDFSVVELLSDSSNTNVYQK